jgi:hypothetical protein
VSASDVQRRFRSLAPFLDERLRRLVAAAESEAIGYGGVTLVARATGVSRRAITEGMKELKQPASARTAGATSGHIRRKGAGRKRSADKDPTLVEDLDRLVDPVTRGDPESPLRWTCKSVRKLAEELQQEGHVVSYQTVGELLHAMDYSLQANQKGVGREPACGSGCSVQLHQPQGEALSEGGRSGDLGRHQEEGAGG